MPTEAVQHVRRMRGGAQAQLMRARDGHFYIVKFQNNPQHLRVLANELLASRLAERVGLPVPVAEVVEVSDWLIANTPELRMDLGSRPVPCAAGLQFGSRYVCDPGEGIIFDYLPESMMSRVKNVACFAGMLVVEAAEEDELLLHLGERLEDLAERHLFPRALRPPLPTVESVARKKDRQAHRRLGLGILAPRPERLHPRKRDRDSRAFQEGPSSQHL